MSITYTIDFDNSNVKNFNEMVEIIFNSVMKCGRDALVKYLEELDKEILSQRDKKRFRCKGKAKTSVKCRLGLVEYERYRYYGNL